MKLSRWSAGLTAVVSATLLASAQVPASATTFTAELVARNSQRCVTVDGAVTTNNGRVVQWDCVDVPNQKWKLVATSAGYYTVRAEHSSKCLTVDGADTGNGGRVVQWDCLVDVPNQEWRLVQKDSGYFSIEARHSGKCLTVQGVSTQNGAALVQWECNEGHNQHFRLG
ncbi:RICIN domain-containing protein [Streptomyces sp. NPDC060064]|uniref:RICIN domain-containing protein n=1 Tax=Streptomyces sp. NPDC060064 TaxID=3347049 RepID=UPI0036C766F1